MVLPRWCWRMRQGERRIHTKSHLVCKTWDVRSICISVGCHKSVPDLEEIVIGKVSWREPSERRIHTKSHLVCKDLGCV